MATDKQIAANRLNAQLSTGPKTEEGKAVVASNAYQHGLRAQRYLAIAPEPDEFLLFWVDLVSQYQPQTRTEEIYVERMALAHYKLCGSEQAEWEHDSLTVRTCQARLENAFDKARTQLLQIQKERKAETRNEVNEADAKKEARKMIDEALKEVAAIRRAETVLSQARSADGRPAQSQPPEVDIVYTDPDTTS